MNLQALTSAVTAAVTPLTAATLRVSTGWIPGPGGVQQPSYAPDQQVMVQVQALTQPDIDHTEGLNLQSQNASIYLPGNWNGIIRQESKGGDLILIDGAEWLIMAVPEQWPDWTRVIACRQA